MSPTVSLATSGALGPSQRVRGRHVVGMHVVSDDFGRDTEESFHARDRFLKGLIGLEILEIADVRAKIPGVAMPDADRVREQSAAGQHGRIEVCRHAYRSGHVTASAPQHRRPTCYYARHRVVARCFDIAVVHEKQIGDAAESRQRLLVPIRERLF